MSNSPPPKPANAVVVIDGDMPWSSVFKLTFKFSIAAFVIWAILSIPFQLMVGGATSYLQKKQQADAREQLREVESRLGISDSD